MTSDDTAGADALSRLVAHDEIRMLASRYALALDSRDLETLVGLFVPDVRIGSAIGRDALFESFREMLRSVGRTVLSVGTHVIDLEGPDDATGSVYCKAEVQEGDHWIHQAVLYEDCYKRVDGPIGAQWRFVRRRHLLFYGAEVGVNPLTLAPANWPEHAQGWGTVPEAWETWRAFWGDDPPPRPGPSG